MSFDWNNFVILAEELRTLQCKGGVEARLRAAVSRSYYGVFHLIRRALQNEGVKFTSGVDVHQEIVQALRTSREESRMKLGLNLGRLRQLRKSADYDDAIGNPAQMDAMASGLCSLIQRQLNAWSRKGST